MAIKQNASGAATLVEHGEQKLAALARVVGLESQLGTMQQIFRDILGVWGQSRLDQPPPWASDVCDDHTPYEFSVAVGTNQPELRVLVEKRGEAATLRSNQIESQQLNRRLEREYGADLSRLRLIEDLFAGPDAQGPFAYWHAVSFVPGRPPEFKLYLNLYAQGLARASALAEEALTRLGFGAAWAAVAERAMRRGPALDVPTYLSLDLTPNKPRLKLYFRHLDANVDDLESACSLARNWVPGRAAEFCKAIAGEGPYLGKGPMTCLSFVEGDGDRPNSSTIYCPMGAYAPNDRVARDRIAGYLRGQGLPINAYAGCLEALSSRPLEAGSGMQSYASLKWADGPKVTVYLAPEVYRVGPARDAAAAAPSLAPSAATVTPVATARLAARGVPVEPESALSLVRHHEEMPVTAHPFFSRMAREPVDLRRLYVLLANFREGIVLDFPRRLAMLTARVDDERVRSILAKQLNDELGDGDYTRAHRGLFEQMLGNLAPFRPAGELEAMVQPGRDFGRELERLYVQAHPDEGVGASLVVEIYGKQADSFVASEFRRQRAVTPDALEWLNLHEHLEVEHADDSAEIARLLPESGPPLAAAWRGASALAAGAWRFFDGMFRVCFP
ncbi:MAG: iron-containing redox enzyme family protein [Polyangiaceae bacterium]|jgi:DMATS type aromatic prenyltransferase|nr:iron-containing redox enzyme family protein [Polyangiaceae bacterium]